MEQSWLQTDSWCGAQVPWEAARQGSTTCTTWVSITQREGNRKNEAHTSQGSPAMTSLP